MSAARFEVVIRAMDSPAARLVAFAIAYFLSAELGHLLTFAGPHESFATYWPPSGLYIAAMLAAKSIRSRLWLIGAALVANVASDCAAHDVPLLTSVGFWVANTVEALAALFAVRRYRLLTGPRLCVRDAGGLALTSIACTGPACAMVGGTVLWLSFGGSWIGTFREWWVSAAVGEIVFLPLWWELLNPQRQFRSYRWSRLPEGILAIATHSVLSLLIFHVGERPIAYMTVPCSLWLALRLGMRGSILGNVILSVIAIWCTANGEGPLGRIEPVAFRVIFIQTFNVTASLSTLILAAVVNERQQSLEERIESDERFRDLFDNVSDLVAVTDLRGKILFANAAWTQVLSPSAQVTRQYLVDWLNPDSREVLAHLLDHLPVAGVLTGIELQIATPDGSLLDVEGSFSCRSGVGRVDRIRIIFRDVTSRKVSAQRLEEAHRQLEAANQQLQLLAATDGLTTLANRRAFYERLSQACHASARQQRAVSLILLDVDHFKMYNDSFGHPAGDDALRTVGTILKEGSRDSDVVGRIGGEEFAVILPETDENEALFVAERLRRMIGGHRWPLRRVTASLGIATHHGGDPDPELLVEAADQALYQAKRSGRDQTVRAANRPTVVDATTS
jgi:diguanylate cyclase (GGDEF)-like protein/PAS domain S-box-containing protein